MEYYGASYLCSYFHQIRLPTKNTYAHKLFETREANVYTFARSHSYFGAYFNFKALRGVFVCVYENIRNLFRWFIESMFLVCHYLLTSFS